jgi:hypothetical protein
MLKHLVLKGRPLAAFQHNSLTLWASLRSR